MRTPFKNPLNSFAPVFLVLVAIFLLGFGCNATDPLAGFHRASKNPDQIIEKDYQDYIQKLSPEEKKYLGTIFSFEDGAGQTAVRIETDIGGKDCWYHILFYDKDNKRIKVVKYFYGRYQS